MYIAVCLIVDCGMIRIKLEGKRNMHASGSEKPTTKQMLAVAMLANAIVDSIREADRGFGVPAGPMYAALMGKISLESFNRIMDGLVRVGRLEACGNHCYRVPRAV